jgi:hypothetical protein
MESGAGSIASLLKNENRPALSPWRAFAADSPPAIETAAPLRHRSSLRNVNQISIPTPLDKDPPPAFVRLDRSHVWPSFRAHL